MNKLRENFLTLMLATRYSVAFCWRHNKRDTIAKIIIAVAGTVVMYLNVQTIGVLMNAVQYAVQHGQRDPLVLVWPLAFFGGVQILNLLTGRADSYYSGKWKQELHYANHREQNQFRARLDIASFGSKRYDDLSKQIRELPYSWGTRVMFADQLLGIFSIALSFTIFGISLLWYKPVYALVLVMMMIPKIVSEFRVVSWWWNLYEKHVPHHKVRGMLERSYVNTTMFVQAKMFNQMKPLDLQISSAERKVIDEYTASRRMVARKKFLTTLLALAGLSLVVVHASMTALLTASAIGTLAIVIASARTFQGNLDSLMMNIAEQWNSAKGVILIERDFFGLESVIKTPDPIVPTFKSPNIRFDRVSFTYPNTDNEVLREVSFEIVAGSKVAIVGKSGNGKSTILSLLMRHYDPTLGAVYADDINLQNIEPVVWNSYASSLLQKYGIQERLVVNEIASSRLGEELDLLRVRASTDFASFHEVVEEHSDGYNAQIGRDFDGREFSGGEEQRLALARVHYRGTPILILDEPDARLDPESADKIMSRIFAMEGVTVIIITHHVSRAEQCDKVIVMGKGSIVEQGDPSELMKQGGVYSRMCTSDKRRLGTDVLQRAES